MTLRSKVKVKQRSLRYATHRLMVMHPHTKYNWPIWKDKKVMVRTSFAEKKQKKRKQNKKLDWNDMFPFVRREDITRKNCFRYLKLMSPLNAAICYLTLRSKSHEGHYGMRHTALWSCTHIPNIIDLSGKTKQLWSGQASPRRGRRKNQTKTICLPSFEGET